VINLNHWRPEELEAIGQGCHHDDADFLIGQILLEKNGDGLQKQAHWQALEAVEDDQEDHVRDVTTEVFTLALSLLSFWAGPQG